MLNTVIFTITNTDQVKINHRNLSPIETKKESQRYIFLTKSDTVCAAIHMIN